MNQPRYTAKTFRFSDYVHQNPGVTSAEIHAALGWDFGNGKIQGTYATIDRMIANKQLFVGPSPRGPLGIGYYTTAEAVPE